MGFGGGQKPEETQAQEQPTEPWSCEVKMLPAKPPHRPVFNLFTKKRADENRIEAYVVNLNCWIKTYIVNCD